MLEKIESWKKSPCTSSEHNPPKHICLKPGDYKYKCPKCQFETIIHIPDFYLEKE